MPKQSIENSTTQFKTIIPAAAGMSEPDEESVARLAYQFWAERGRPEGSPEEDWFRAQELLRAGKAVMTSSSLS
jgi:Protein of unknown function (DUF2934)